MPTLFYPGKTPEFRLYIAARAAYIRVGYAEPDGEKINLPFIEVSYGLDELQYMSVLLSEMAAKKLRPEVYTWSEKANVQHLAVMFGIPKPTARFVEKICSASGQRLPAGTRPALCSEILATGEAELPRNAVVEIMHGVKRIGRAHVIITDASTDPREALLPVRVFEINTITNSRPAV